MKIQDYSDGQKNCLVLIVFGLSNCFEVEKFGSKKCEIPKFSLQGRGLCLDKNRNEYDSFKLFGANSILDCAIECQRKQKAGLLGFNFDENKCLCHYENNAIDNLKIIRKTFFYRNWKYNEYRFYKRPIYLF